jgi:hypothetical protein
MGFQMHQSGAITTHTKGTGSGYLINDASASVGDTTVTVDTGTGTILAGDIVTIAGTTDKYVVNTALASTTFTIGAPGLVAAEADNDAVTVGNSYRPNVVFDRNAIHLITRAPAMPMRMTLSRLSTRSPAWPSRSPSIASTGRSRSRSASLGVARPSRVPTSQRCSASSTPTGAVAPPPAPPHSPFMTVKMHREFAGKGNSTADVHADEVANWIAAGWKITEQPKPEKPAEKKESPAKKAK